MSTIRKRLGLDEYEEQENNNSIRERLSKIKTTEQLKKEYDAEKQEFERRKTLLQKNLQNNAIITGNSYTSQYKPNNLQVLESTKLNLGSKNRIPTFTDEVENRRKYESAIKTDTSKELINKIEEQRNIKGYAGYEYNRQKVEEEDITLFDKTIGNVFRGVGSLFDIGDQVRDEKGNLYSLPSYNELKQQKVNENYDTKVGQILGNVTYEGTRILSTSLLNKLTLGAGGSALYYGDMFKSSYDQAMRDGYDNDSSVLYASLGTLTQFATGKFLGSATKGLTGGKTSELSKGLQKGFDKLINNRGLSNFLANATSEGIEEFTQEYLDNFNRLLTLEKETNPTKYLEVIKDPEVLSNAMYSAAVGAITGGTLNIPSSIALSKANNVNLNQQLSNQETQNFIEKNNIRPTQINNNEISLSKIDTNQEVNIQQNLEKLSTKREINEITTDKYANINEAIYDYANNIKDNFSTNIDIETNKTKIPIDYSQQSQTTIFNKAKEMFSKIGKTVFQNNGENIYVSNGDIKESIAKTVRNTKQKKLIAEHIEVFKNLDKIIENGTLIAKGSEAKERTEYREWDYYATPINLDGEQYIVEFDTVYRTDDSNKKHFRLERIYSLEEATKKQIAPTEAPINLKLTSTNRFVEQPVSNDNNTTNLTKSQIAPLPSQYSMQQNVENDTKIPSYKDFSKVMNPNEISQLTMEDANTTPLLPKTKRNNQNANEESSFYKNTTEKSKFLTEENRGTIGNEEDVQYYKGITNEDTLNEAKTKLDNGGMSETLNWFNRNKVDSNGKMKHNPTAVDVAEGWILLKQYQDAGDYDSMVEVAKTMREIGTQAGQTVQAYNIMARLTPEGMVKYAQSELSEAYEQMCKNKTKEWIDSNRDKFNLTSQEVQAIIEIMEKVQTMEDGYNKKVELAKIQKIMTDKLPPERGAGIKTWMRISMLFNPKTQVRNVMGNAVIAPVNYFSDLFSSAVDSMVAKKTGYRTTGVTNIGNYVKGFKKGAFESYNDFKEGINTRNIEGNRFEITEGKSFNDNTSIGKALNKVDSLLGFMLDAGDRTFYEATFTNSINNQMKLNNTDTVTQEMIDIATQEALSRTWQDNNNYTKFVLNVRKMMNNINVKGYGLGDVLIPFAKTPANLTKAIVDYSPLGLMQTINDGINLKKSLSNGQYNAQMQHKFVQDLGKATAGTMLYVLGYALAKAGITSGESDDDKDVANFMKNTLGVSSYSIKIGNKTFTYDWAQPLAAPLSITSNIVQKQKENATLYDSVISSLDTAGNILLEQSFMESISTVLNNNEGIATGIQEAILELPSRAIPTLMKQITDLTDGTQRTTFEKDKPLETAFNKIKAKIPGLSKTLAPTKDTLGRNVKKYGGKNNMFNVFVNPANVNNENISKSAEEIYRVYKATGEKSVMPRVPEYKYKDEDGNEIILNSQQRAEYQEISGKIIEDNIEKLLNTTEYKKLADIEKAEVLNNIVNYSYNVAKKEVLDLDISQTYEKAYEYSEIGNISDYYTFKANIDNTNSDTKKESISSYLINSNLNNKQLAYLYGSYYSTEETLNSLLNANVPIKEFIKFNSQNFEGDFNAKTGKTVSGSRQKKVINYVNSLNLSIPQKALLIKMEYKSYKKYDKQIAEYVNSQNISFLDKAQILKKANFTSFDKQIINYVNSQSMTVAEKTEILEDLGFTVKNGRVY